MTFKIVSIDNNEFLLPRFFLEVSSNKSLRLTNYIRTDFLAPTLSFFKMWLVDLYSFPKLDHKDKPFIFRPKYFEQLEFVYLIDLFKFSIYFDIELLSNTIGYILANSQNLTIYVFINGTSLINCTIYNNDNGLSHNFVEEIKYVAKFITYDSTQTNDFIVDILHVINDYEEPIDYEKYLRSPLEMKAYASF